MARSVPLACVLRNIRCAFCIPCVFFGRNIGPNASKLDRLVKRPLIDWCSASTKLKDHQLKSEVHKTAVESMQHFYKVMSHVEKSIDQVYDEKVSNAITLNRLKLKSIAQTVMLCGRQNFPLRGHRDDAKYYDSGDCGNFQALLDFRVESGDCIIEDHFKTPPRNATFRSKTVQNELICCCADEINEQILEGIRKCGLYSILADEVTDCSNHQLMPLVLRYVDRKGEIQERFLRYITCDTGTTGEALKDKILACLTNDLNLDIMKCRGQCYDGAGNMAGKFSGLASRILQINDLALYTHCASHRLNLAVAAAAACNFKPINNVMESVRTIAAFFNKSPKRQRLLEQMLKKHLPKYNRNKLINPCRTRWVLRIDAMERFIEMFVPLYHTLTTMRDNKDCRWEDSAGEAARHTLILQHFDFITTLVTTAMLLGYTRSATVQPQSSHLDVTESVSQVNIMMKSLQTARLQIDQYHSLWFTDAVEIAEKVDAVIRSPRTCSSQIYRGNVSHKDVNDYFRLNIAIPFLDSLLQELSARFTKLHCVKGYFHPSSSNEIAVPGAICCWWCKA